MTYSSNPAGLARALAEAVHYYTLMNKSEKNYAPAFYHANHVIYYFHARYAHAGNFIKRISTHSAPRLTERWFLKLAEVAQPGLMI